MTTMQDLAMRRFFSKLRYSFGNEDWRTERKALQIRPGNNVLCISASGDRSLHLLLDECGSLTSVDANPVQNFLLKLKCAALQALDYDDYIGFLGGVPHKHRNDLFRKVLPHTSDSASRFWLRNEWMIRKGVLYQGVLERLSQGVSTAFSLVRPRKMRKLFAIDDLAEQQKYLPEWDTYLFRKLFNVVLSPRLCRFFAIDPGLYVHADPHINLGSYIYGRIINSLNQCLAKENILFSLIFRGYIEPAFFPPYLKPDGCEEIRQKLDRLSIVTQDINLHLEATPKNSYDCFSLSDVASYLSKADFDRLIGNVYRTAKPGARFCIRQFSSNQVIPPEYEKRFKRDAALEKRLEHEDQCFVYRFMTGEVVK